MNFFSFLNKHSEKCVILILIIYSFFINHYYGFQGFNYVDSFQHITGGKKILEGSLPFKDYWMTNSGPLMDLMQAFYFKFFGISWNSLVLNASIFNVIFTLNTYFFCKLLNTDNLSKIFLPLCAATIMYPSSGTPLIDYHSIIVSMVGLTYFLYFLNKKNFFLLGFTPFFFVIALFFKQVPSFYIALIILAISLFLLFKKEKKVFFSQIIGSLIIIILSLILFNFLDIKIINIYEQYIVMPLSEYSFREENFDTSLFSSSQKIRYVVFLLIPFIFILFNKLKNKKINNNLLNLLLITGLFMTAIIHESYTWNQATTLGLLPFISAILIKLSNNKSKLIEYFFYTLILGLILRLIFSELYFLYIVSFLFVFYFIFKNKLNSIAPRINLLIIFYSILTTMIYYDKLIDSRRWQDIYDPNWKKNSLDAGKIDVKLKKIKWISNNPNTKEEFVKVQKNLTYLKNNSNEGNYILITHYQIYNMILNSKNYSPVKYWWLDSSYPNSNIKLKKKFDSFFINQIKKNNITKIIVLEDAVIGNFDIKNFEWLNKCILIEKEASSNFRIVYKINQICIN